MDEIKTKIQKEERELQRKEHLKWLQKKQLQQEKLEQVAKLQNAADAKQSSVAMVSSSSNVKKS